MKKIVLNISNQLLEEGIITSLSWSGEFKVEKSVNEMVSEFDIACLAHNADIALMEASYAEGYTLDEELVVSKRIKELVPSCKIVILCDENSFPDIAKQVVVEKQKRTIDAFFYASVTSGYLIDSLNAL